MSKIHLNLAELNRWIVDKGDETHNITYELNENSNIMDLGGYSGIWAQQMIDKYNPNVYILEPVPNFYNNMVHKFETNRKVKLMCAGVANENKEGYIFISGDGTSTSVSNGDSIKVKFKTIDTILKEFELKNIDLLQINIEGDEYSLLEYMIENKIINIFKNIQIQFHLGIVDDVKRRDKIHYGLLSSGFKNKFNYPFVWESWYQ